MARYREAKPPGVHPPDKPGPWGGGVDGSDDLDVFAAERYFNGDDAPWCARSSSSASSAFRMGTAHEHDRCMAATATAATSSSEASWNSRSALLPEGKALAAVGVPAPSVVDAGPHESGGERPREKLSPSSSQLRRLLLGVALCGCAGGDGEDSASGEGLSRDEVEDDNVAGVGGKKLANGASELFQGTESKELAVGEAAAVRVRLGRSLDNEDEFLAGKAAFSPVQVHLAGDFHRRAVNAGEFSAPTLNPATTGALLNGQRRKSYEMLRSMHDFGRSAIVSTKKQDSAFTILAGGGGLHAAHGGPDIGPCDWSEDDAALSEVGCVYPPSEASVVWSVVTAEGAASCNFSSAASGYYYHLNRSEERQAAGKRNRRRRRGVTNGGGLLTCMGDKAVSAIGPARWPEIEPASVGRPGARSVMGGTGRVHDDVMRRR